MSPIFGFTCTWFTRSSRYSTGSSAVMIFVSGVFTCWSAAYSVVVLPLPVGPVTSSIPAVRSVMALTRSAMSGGMPRSGKPSWLAFV